MGSAIHDFWVVFRHELTCCRRNWPFILTALAFPVAIMMLAMGVNFGAIQEMSHVPRLAIVGDQPLTDEQKMLVSALADSSSLKLVHSRQPIKDMNAGQLDAVVSFPDGDKAVRLSLPAATTSEHADDLEAELKLARRRTLNSLPQMAATPSGSLGVFRLKRDSLGFSTNGVVQLVAICTGLMLFHLASSMSSATQVVWAEETRSKAIINVLMLPVNRFALVLAKALTMTLLAFFSIAVYQIAFLVTIIGVAIFTYEARAATGSSAMSFGGAAPASASPAAASAAFQSVMGMPWLQFFVLCVIVFWLFSYLCAAVSMVVVALLKQKQTSASLGWILSAVALPMLAGFDMSMRLDTGTQFIPVLNIILLLKSCLLGTLQWYQPLLVIAETMALIAVIGLVGVKLLGSDHFFLNVWE